MKFLYTIFTLAFGGYGLFWLSDKHPEIKQKTEEFLNFRTTNALETRFGVEQVQEIHQKKLLKERGTRFLNSELKFYPYLLLEVKYSDKIKTKEGLILWDLTDGEMVLDTKTWDKTHGFADCILTSAQLLELRVIQSLAEKGGMGDLNELQTKLGIDMPMMEMTIRSCLKKNLIIANGPNCYRLHLEKPKFALIPETKLNEQLTTRPQKKAHCASKHFSRLQIERIAKMSFGENFSIRNSTEVFLPVHRVIIQNPDGSIHTSHFNALTGQELPPISFYQ